MITARPGLDSVADDVRRFVMQFGVQGVLMGLPRDERKRYLDWIDEAPGDVERQGRIRLLTAELLDRI